MTTIWDTMTWTDPNGNEHSARQSRVFVPSTVFDNPALLKNDPLYVQRLASMPAAERQALLYGDWDTFSGQVFTEWRNDPEQYETRRNTHVIAPFEIPKDWGVWCGFDFGYSRPFAVGWYAVDHERRLYHIRELYGCTGAPNVGVKWEPTQIARKIREIEADDPNLKGRTIHRVGDPAIWQSDGTESVGALMERERVYFERGDHARIAGKMQLHHRLAFDDEGVPMFYCFSTCKNFIRTVPALVYDETNVEDIDTDGEDHCLTGDTLVLTDEGYKPIEELVGTEGKVLSHDGQYHAYHDVRKTRESAEIIEIEFEDGTKIKCTDDHRFMLPDGEWIAAGDLSAGKEVMSIDSSNYQRHGTEV